MIKILMVCLGNICRSPLAEGILKSKLKDKKFIVESAGTSGFHSGSSPDPRSIAIAKKNNIDITKQKSRAFISNDFDIFDHIFVMDYSNYKDVIRLARNQKEKEKVKLILDYPYSTLNEVPDPYYGGDDGFSKIFAIIEKACYYHSKQLQISS